VRLTSLWPGCAGALPVPAAALRRLRSRAAMVLTGLFVLLVLGSRPAVAADTALVLGVFPHLTPKQLIENHQPLASALEERLGRRVAIYSAPNFRTFVERTRRGDYDILLTPPHMAWLARQDAGYRPLLKYAHPVRGLLVVRTDSPFAAPEDLRGRIIATADAIAVVGLAIQADLAARGLEPGRDYRTIESGTHSSTVMQVVNKRADGAMIGLHAFQLMPEETRSQLRVIARTPPLSSLTYLTHPRMDDRQAQRVRQALLDFAASPEGRAFIQRGQYGGLVDVDGHELQAFRPYALQAQELLRAPR
jgi:phosphonate transport system substrate-binding protein